MCKSICSSIRQVGGRVGRQADKIQVGLETFKTLYRLNCLGFYFLFSITTTVLELHFGRLLSSKACFKVCFELQNIRSSFFISIPSIRY